MKKGPLYKTIRVCIVLLVALVIAALLIKLRPQAERQAPVEAQRLVEVIAAKAEEVQMIIETFGTVQPRESLKLVAQVPGQIVAIDPDFKEGNFIKKGTRLIQIDPRTYELEVERRRVQIKQAEADLKRLDQEAVNLGARINIAASDVGLAKNEYMRLKQLIDRRVIAQSQLEKAEQIYLASLERLQALENQMALIDPQKEQLLAARDMALVLHRQAELDLERSSIVALFDGWVLVKDIEVGQHVTVGQNLGRIYSAGGLDIEVRIPVKDFKWFHVNSSQATPVAAEISFSNAGENHTWKGRIARVKAEMDTKTRTVPVVIEVDDTFADGSVPSSFHLRPGMFVTVNLKGNEVHRVFVLPRHLIYPGDVVYTVKDDRLTVKPVVILRSYKDSVMISAGLDEGELIVKTPLSSASEGMRVRVNEEDR
jgi:RND family efflux transporter MFP subunit